LFIDKDDEMFLRLGNVIFPRYLAAKFNRYQNLRQEISHSTRGPNTFLYFSILNPDLSCVGWNADVGIACCQGETAVGRIDSHLQLNSWELVEAAAQGRAAVLGSCCCWLAEGQEVSYLVQVPASRK
jgi:hypothetical protein